MADVGVVVGVVVRVGGGAEVGVVVTASGDCGDEVGVGVGVRADGVAVAVGEGFGVVFTGVDVCSVTSAGVSLTGAGVCVARGIVGREDGASTGAVLVDSPPLNGYASTSVISATGITMAASAVVRRGPPYLPIGPRTGLPCLSTQNGQRAGGGPQDSGGCHRRGGRQSGRGGAGHSGGALNCLTEFLPEAA
ncbi:hypothetical protein [Kribbella sp. NPDC004875]|uniref:hypothetical protein n=1 Tax=Kribbella sp. NPDC004875 TaxID=3364107 RepID=UPI0036C6D91F